MEVEFFERIFMLEINQQILEDQSAQSTNYNTDSGIDAGNQRPRSSITRTLLMNHGKICCN